MNSRTQLALFGTWMATVLLGASNLSAFEGKITGTVDEIESNGKWFMLTVSETQPPSNLVGQRVKVMVNWHRPQGRLEPKPNETSFVKALRGNTGVQTFQVATSAGGLRLRGIAGGKPQPGGSKPRIKPILASHVYSPPVAATPEKVDPSRVQGAQVDESKIAITLHVNAKSGVDTNDGSDISAPLKTLGSALEKAKPALKVGQGVKILLAAGTYREGGFAIDGNALGGQAKEALLVIEGAAPGQAILTGSDVWEPSSWKSTGGVFEHPFSIRLLPTRNNRLKSERGARREMVFINGKPLKQQLVKDGAPRDVLKPGEFCLSANGRTLVIKPHAGVNFDTALVEVAVRPDICTISNKENVVVRNLVFQHTAGDLKRAALGFGQYWEKGWRRNLLVEDCELRWNNGVGLSIVWSEHVTLRNVNAIYNGFKGINCVFVNDMKWERMNLSFNNWRGNWGEWRTWAMGGMKIMDVTNCHFTDILSVGNACAGWWYDINGKNITVERLYCLANFRGPINEIVLGPLLYRDCIFAFNDQNGTGVSNSLNLTFENCILYGNTHSQISVQCSGRDLVPNSLEQALGASQYRQIDYSLKVGPIAMRNCVIARPDDGPLIRQGNSHPPTYAKLLTDHLDFENNVWFSAKADSFGKRFNYGARDWQKTMANVWGDYAWWVAETGEKGSQWADPGFSDPDNFDFSLRANSPCKGMDLPSPKFPEDMKKKIREFWNFADYEPNNPLLGGVF